MDIKGLDVLAPWGKTSKMRGYHPALFHLIDVAHVSQELLGPSAPLHIQRTLARVLGVSRAEHLRTQLPVIVALHDIGKISSPFQRQDDTQRARLEALGFEFAPVRLPRRHQHLSSAALSCELIARYPVLSPVSQLIIDAIAGHHGKFPNSLREDVRFNRQIEIPLWKELRVKVVDQLLNLFPLPDVIDIAPSHLRSATVVLTGFMILCDWIGSDEGHFHAEPNLTLEEYVAISKQRAKAAVGSAGFHDGSHVVPAWEGFRALFPTIDDPHPLQLEVDALPDSAITSPGLFIIEAPTGKGKTEMALALARRLEAAGHADGIYIGLPTMATSNQMYGRVQRFLNSDTTRPGAVKLLHGQALLVEDSLRMNAFGDERDPESPAAAVPSWFSPRKRALLARNGVGTVDQAELCVLNARHYMLRLFGLAGKVVIIDEVHAYDSYMNTIIDHALWWLATTGTPVILLSATLPITRHRELARAYQRGCTHEPLASEAENNESIPYPILAIYTRDEPTTRVPPIGQPERPLTFRFLPELSAGEEAQRLLDLVRDGGAVCRITNTVARAQEIYEELRRLNDAVESYLLHARYPGDERLQRERAIEDRLGRNTTRAAHDSIIVIGTQVLEQSLDYDVDFMISDLAPIDLLLQRAGRVHRHVREWGQRPSAHQAAMLGVVVGAEGDGLLSLGTSQYVYEPFILWKSWLVLQLRTDAEGQVRVSLPDDYRPLIEATYDERSDVVDSSHPGRVHLESALKVLREKRHKQQQNATQRLIPEPHHSRPITETAAIQFTEDDDGGKQGWGFAATRDGAESISIVPLHRSNGRVFINLDGKPLPSKEIDWETQLCLQRRAIRISRPELVRTLPTLEHPELPWWKDTPQLRHHVPLVFEGGVNTSTSLLVRLDGELGLVYGPSGQIREEVEE